MSTKIYTGFIVTHNNPSLLQKQLKELQREHTQWALETISGYLPNGPLLSDKEEENRKTIERWYEDQLMGDVVIYFKKNRIIGQYFIHDREREKWFTEQKWVKDYHWQDQTDPDEEVSPREWKQREKDWSFLNVPANDGFLFYLVNPKEITPYWVAVWRQKYLKKL